MAISDAYATAVEYRARAGKTDTGDDATILAQLTAVSRYIERELGRFFNQDAAVVTRYYNGNGQQRLYVDEIATTTGLVVKIDLDEDYVFTGANEILTIVTHFWVGPYNAALGPEARPYTFLEIVPGNGVFSEWPIRRRAAEVIDQPRSVEVTAKFGWPAVPAAIRELTIAITRQLRDMEEAGFTLTMQNIDAMVRLAPSASVLLRDIARQYGRVVLFA